MKTENENCGRFAAELLAQLEDDKMTMIDFDRVKLWLSSVAARLSEEETASQQLQLLRQDYQARIGGMVKAISAADRSSSRLEQALEFVESLASMDSRELIEQYRKASACFRDTFPASFNRFGNRSRNEAGPDSSIGK